LLAAAAVAGKGQVVFGRDDRPTSCLSLPVQLFMSFSALRSQQLLRLSVACETPVMFCQACTEPAVSN